MTFPFQSPKSDAEWARNTEKRLRLLESPHALRIGPWVIGSQDGELVATKAGSQTLQVGQVPGEPIVADLTRGLTVSDLTEALTGTAGPLESLVEWASNIPLIGPLVEALTGVPGVLADIVSWVEGIPVIGPLVEAITGVVGGTLSTLQDFFGGLFGGVGTLLDQVVSVIAGALTGLGGGVAAIAEWAGNLPLIGPLVEAITGVVGGGMAALENFFGGFASGAGSLLQQIVEAFTGLPGSLGDIVTWVESLPLIGPLVEAITGIPGTIADIATWAVDVLTGRSPLFSGNLVGQIGAGIIGLIPGAHVASVSPNLVTDGDFPDAVSLAGGDDWTWDGTNGNTTLGCASVTCSGKALDLSSDLIQVAQGHVLAASGWTMWSGLAGAGSNPIKLQLIRYQNVGSSSRPSWSQVGVTNIATDTSGLTGSGWRQLSGSYTVPINEDAVRLNVHIDATATAGTVKWDDLSLTKTQKMSLGLLDGLVDIIGEIWTFLQDLLDGIVSVIRRVPFVGGVLADAIEALEDLVGLGHDAKDAADEANLGLADLLWKLLNVPSTILGFIGDEIVPGIARTLENIWNGLTGHSDTEGVVGHTEAQAALESNAAALTAAQAEITLLKQSLTGGVSASDTFSRDEGTAGANWAAVPVGSTVYYPHSGSGHPQTDGNNLTWQDSGNTPNTKLLRWIGPGQHSLGRYQAVSIVLSTRGEDPLFGKTSGDQILARVSDDGLNYLRLQANAYVGNVDDPALQLFYCVGGVETRLWWKDIGPVPASGSVVTLLAGLKGFNERTHVVILNNNIVDEITETGPVSWVTSTPNTMGWGLGMTAGENIGIWPFQRQAKPGKINTWTAQDQ